MATVWPCKAKRRAVRARTAEREKEYQLSNNSIAENGFVNTDDSTVRIERMCQEAFRRQGLTAEERRDEDAAKTQAARRFTRRYVRFMMGFEGDSDTASKLAAQHAHGLERLSQLVKGKSRRFLRPVFGVASRPRTLAKKRARSYRSPRRAAKTADGGDDDGQGDGSDPEPPRHFLHVNPNKFSNTNSLILPWSRHGCSHVGRRSS
jgi:hypothetical protein